MLLIVKVLTCKFYPALELWNLGILILLHIQELLLPKFLPAINLPKIIEIMSKGNNSVSSLTENGAKLAL